MNFEKHLNLTGRHALFSPSQSSWLRYDDNKVVDYYRNKQAAEIGTRLHAWVQETINLGIKQPTSKRTLYAYVNDAIGFKMSTEVILFYSNNFFGTADAICFRDNVLRIHDLKTGEKPAGIEQLYVYTALFCLEYKIKPTEIDIELRIYQNDEVHVEIPDPKVIRGIMDHIVHLDKVIEKLNLEEG